MQWSPETEDIARFNLKTTTVEILFLKIIEVQLKANKSHYTVPACTVLSSHLAVSKFRYSAGDSLMSSGDPSSSRNTLFWFPELNRLSCFQGAENDNTDLHALVSLHVEVCLRSGSISRYLISFCLQR